MNQEKRVVEVTFHSTKKPPTITKDEAKDITEANIVTPEDSDQSSSSGSLDSIIDVSRSRSRSNSRSISYSKSIQSRGFDNGVRRGSYNYTNPPLGHPLCFLPICDCSLYFNPMNPNMVCSTGHQGANLFIFHLPSNLDNLTLYLLFRKFGEILSSRVIINYKTGLSKGYGFVSFSTSNEADLAILYMNAFKIGNKRLKVEKKRCDEYCYDQGCGSSSSSG
jgi:RNA recognition motif-containing protein